MMVIRLTLSTFILSLICSFAFNQTIQGYSFSTYKTSISDLQKAPLNLKSHLLGSTFKTTIKEQYKNGKIDFAGHYITTIWGAGMGLTKGVMVDVMTGNIYELPLKEENSYRGVYHDNNNNIIFKADSNLFVTYVSAQNANNESLVDLIYYFYKWDDLIKKFTLIKTKKVTTKMIDN